MNDSTPSEVDDQEPDRTPDPRIDQLWQKEAERRYAAYLAGELETVPAEEIFGDE